MRCAGCRKRTSGVLSDRGSSSSRARRMPKAALGAWRAHRPTTSPMRSSDCVPRCEPVQSSPAGRIASFRDARLYGVPVRAQNFRGALCYRCEKGYYPLIGLCLECPDKKTGISIANVGNVIAIYGGICLLWLVLNRFIAEKLIFMDTICTFCQVRRALRSARVSSPTRFANLGSAVRVARCRRALQQACLHNTAIGVRDSRRFRAQLARFGSSSP